MTVETKTPPTVEWLVDGGEMGTLIHSMGWTETALGPIELWLQSFRTTVSLCLTLTFPDSLGWGAKHVQIYNHGYWPIYGGRVCADSVVDAGATFRFTLGGIS